MPICRLCIGKKAWIKWHLDVSQGLIKLWLALDLDPVRALVHGRDDDAGVVELALDGAQLEAAATGSAGCGSAGATSHPPVVVDDRHEVVADVPLLLVALGIALPEIRKERAELAATI